MSPRIDVFALNIEETFSSNAKIVEKAILEFQFIKKISIKLKEFFLKI